VARPPASPINASAVTSKSYSLLGQSRRLSTETHAILCFLHEVSIALGLYY
jgi:hypothetical protein